jgi:hypothetical protein
MPCQGLESQALGGCTFASLLPKVAEEFFMFAKIKEFFVARSFVAKHGNRFLTVYHAGKHVNGQISHIGLFRVTIREARPSSQRYISVPVSQVVRVHRDHKRLAVRKEQTAVVI